MFAMVKAYPEEFRCDVITVARKGETSVRQVAQDFGVSSLLASATAVLKLIVQATGGRGSSRTNESDRVDSPRGYREFSILVFRRVAAEHRIRQPIAEILVAPGRESRNEPLLPL
jgi:transposase-like protein